jgi:hypothetical protein
MVDGGSDGRSDRDEWQFTEWSEENFASPVILAYASTRGTLDDR